MNEEIKRWTQTAAGKIYIALALIVTIAIFALSMIYLPEYSSFTAALLKASVGITLFYLFDKYALKEVDTIEELKKGNIAYSIFLATIGAFIVAAMLAS